VSELKNYNAKDTTANMFFDEKIDKSTFFWTDNYVTGSSFQKFWPHITLKTCVDPKFDGLPTEFTKAKPWNHLSRIPLTHGHIARHNLFGTGFKEKDVHGNEHTGLIPPALESYEDDIAELQRIASHLVAVGTFGLDVDTIGALLGLYV